MKIGSITKPKRSSPLDALAATVAKWWRKSIGATALRGLLQNPFSRFSPGL